MKEVIDPNCGRENDLVAFLYGELNDDESRTFQRHMKSCAACTTELGSLKDVRDSVVLWRNESLGGVVSPVMIADSSPARAVREKPSALEALREFFNLSPLWLKGAVAFASILFCLFAGLAIARLRETPSPVAVATRNDALSEAQLNALVQQRVQEQMDKLRNSAEPPPPTVAVVKQNSSPRIANRANVASNDPIQKARRPLSKTEREQLAADLRLVSAKNEGDLDLLDDGINQ